MTCACGYAERPSPAAAAANLPPPAAQPPAAGAAAPGGQPPAKAKKLLSNALIVIIWIGLCALGVYFLGPQMGVAPDRWARDRFERGLAAVNEELRQREQPLIAKAEQENRDKISQLEKQARLLSNVSTDADVEVALRQIERSVLISVRLQILQARFPVGLKDLAIEKMPDELLNVGNKRASNARAALEAAKVLSAELMKVAANHPRAFDPACEKILHLSTFTPRENKKLVPRDVSRDKNENKQTP
jgi:hypothetical protein